MKIYVDADACPVTRIAERVAKEYGIPVVLGGVIPHEPGGRA